jgi:sulfur-oxidizing protein SoxA
VDGTEGKSCASCHESVEDFAGLYATMPKVIDGKLTVMEDLINTHRAEVMGAEPWKWSGNEMQSMVALIGLQSRGMPMNVAIDGDAAPFWEQGKEMYYTRYGQLELSCSNCHEDNYGNMIRADHLSQGQINGFPTYRLKQAKLISKHNRFRGCIRDTRAETFAEGSDEFRALELYVASRGNGLDIETPAVRQ